MVNDVNRSKGHPPRPLVLLVEVGQMFRNPTHHARPETKTIVQVGVDGIEVLPQGISKMLVGRTSFQFLVDVTSQLGQLLRKRVACRNFVFGNLKSFWFITRSGLCGFRLRGRFLSDCWFLLRCIAAFGFGRAFGSGSGRRARLLARRCLVRFRRGTVSLPLGSEFAMTAWMLFLKVGVFGEIKRGLALRFL